MSKTAGTAVTLGDAIERHGSDALRYFLLREVGFEADGNFTWERFDERYSSDLADGLGNLASRSLAMLVRYRNGSIPPDGSTTPLDQSGREALSRYAAAMDALDLRGGAEAAWSLVSAANLYVQQTAPWALAKAGKNTELDLTLAALARALVRLAIMTAPFIPAKSQALWTFLGMEGEVGRANWTLAEQPVVAGHTVRPPEVLFPKPAAV
jgi:methionyl-tRNA synthetase